jgi:tetratricopeptide (TPR) repeat protein
LSKDGRPNKKLRRAQRLLEQGCDLAIVPEEELLDRLHWSGGRLRRKFTLRELQQMLDVSAERLASWLRAGLIAPIATIDGIRYFDFCQVSGAKSLSDLVRSGITTARLRQSLRQLRKWLGGMEHPLAQLTRLDQGSKLVVRLDDGQLAEPSGQLLFDFAPDAAPPSLPWVSELRTAEEWFDLACHKEDEGRYDEAAKAYRQALLLGGPTAERCFNLANVLYSLGQFARAGERYRLAIELNPNFWEAWNNLGSVLTHENLPDEAIEAYEQALRLHSGYADAHYNLADTLAELGRHYEAREHWQSYLRLEPHGAWAEHARNCLDRPLDV